MQNVRLGKGLLCKWMSPFSLLLTRLTNYKKASPKAGKAHLPHCSADTENLMTICDMLCGKKAITCPKKPSRLPGTDTAGHSQRGRGRGGGAHRFPFNPTPPIFFPLPCLHRRQEIRQLPALHSTDSQRIEAKPT